MKLQLITVGKLREPYFKAACNEYLNRIQRFLPIEVHEVSPATGEGGNGSGKGALGKEAETIEKLLTPRATLVTLDARGQTMSSEELSAWLQEQMLASADKLAFVIGGAWGLSTRLTEAAGLNLSLSRLTLPHELAQVVLLEQLYRALTLWKNLPYHK